jgi:hypothetical protein
MYNNSHTHSGHIQASVPSWCTPKQREISDKYAKFPHHWPKDVAFEFPTFIQKLKQHQSLVKKGSRIAPVNMEEWKKNQSYNSSKQHDDYYQSCNLHENKQTAGRNWTCQLLDIFLQSLPLCSFIWEVTEYCSRCNVPVIITSGSIHPERDWPLASQPQLCQPLISLASRGSTFWKNWDKHTQESKTRHGGINLGKGTKS